MLILKKQDQVPPGGWRYEDPTFGMMFSGPNPHVLIQRIVDHYHNNGKKPPLDLSMLVDNYICNRLPDIDRHCKDVDPPSWPSRVRRAGQAIKNFWKQHGQRLVNAEQLAERQAICEQCIHWNGSAVLGAGACKACGCSGLKLYAVSENCPAEKWPKL